MSTVESPHVRAIWGVIHKFCPWAAYAGSVGDDAHQQHPSYHNGFLFSKRKFGLGKYSLSMFGDRRPPKGGENDAAAIDISEKGGGNGHLKKVMRNLIHAAVHNPKALTSIGVREFAGPDPDGGGVIAYSEKKRLGRASIFVRTTGWDSSHRTHIHTSINRHFTRNPIIHSIAQFYRGA